METHSQFSISNLFGEKIPKEQNFLLIEDINSKGELILFNFIKEFVEKGFRTVLVLLDPIPYSILEEIVARESEEFIVVNTYSDLFSKYYTSMKLHELNLTVKALRKQLKSEQGLAFFYWSLNPLFINYTSNDVTHFVLENIRHSIENNTWEFYLLDKGAIDEITLKRLISMAHCVLELTAENNRRPIGQLTFLKTMALKAPIEPLKYRYKLGLSIWEHEIFFIDHL